MGDDSSLPEPSARRLARVAIPVLTSGRGRETSPGRSLYGWAKFRLRTFSKNPHNSRTKGAECGMQDQGEAGIAQVRQGIATFRATGAAQLVPYYCTMLADVAAHLGHT